MIDINDFCSLYNEKILMTRQNGFSIKESDKGAFVKGATFILNGGSFDYCGECIWNCTEDFYTKQSQGFNFRKKCDGFTFCRVGGRHYLIWIELKSSFSESFNKEIFQLSSCYVKMKSYLNVFTKYVPDEFEEIGIVVCRPEDRSAYTENDNSVVLNRRNSLVSQENTALEKCRRRYRKKGKLILIGDDFGVSSINLKQEIKLCELPVFTYFTNEENPTVDLAQVIRETLGHEP